MTRILFILFGLCAFVATGQSITTAEYFFDTDPGVGNATSIALNSNTGQLTQSLTLPTTGLSEGFHSLNIRTLSSLGNWSLYDRTIIYITSFTNTSGAITAAEYYFNTDPGTGNGEALTVDPNVGLLAQAFIIPTTGLPKGTHIFFIRVQDENGTWSLSDSEAITISGSAIDNSVTLVETSLTATYNASGTSYQWVNCGTGTPIAGETGRGFEASESGNYSVEITSGDQTVVSDCIPVTVLPPIDDDDGDGVANNLDTCPQTPVSAVVDVNGCEVFSLASTNFSILGTGESCIGSNNGSIKVEAQANLNYTATLTDANGSYSNAFTTDTLFENLSAGTHTICLTVEGQAGYENCQNIVITEPEALSVTSKISTSESLLTLHLKGGKNYTINLNDATYTTSENEITIPLVARVNNVSVKTDKDCQGIYLETIRLDTKALVYPNPISTGDLTVYLGHGERGSVDVSLYTVNGIKILDVPQKVVDNKILLNVDALSRGMYLLTVRTNSEALNYKIIRK